MTREETVTLLVGNASKDGSLYAKTDASDVVYLIGADYLQALRDFDTQSLRNKRVCAVKSTDVESADVTIGGKTSTITVPAYALDGSKIDAEQYDAFFAAVQSINAESFADKDASAQDATIVVTFHTSRPGFETVTLRLAPYDRSFYIDDHGALVNKRDAEQIVKTFESIGEK